MKSILVLPLIALIAAPSYLKAQEKENVSQTPNNKVRIALRAGVYLSRFQIQSNYNISFTGDDAVYGGLQVQIPLSKNLYIAPEVLYAISSVTYQNATPPLQGLILGSDDLSQILIPVQLKYQAGKFGFYIGGQADILANAKATRPNIYLDRNVTDSSYKKVAYSAIAGAEFVFSYRFGIDFRYHRSLSNMRANNGSTLATDNGSVKLSAFQAGIFFRFGKKPMRKNK